MNSKLSEQDHKTLLALVQVLSEERKYQRTTQHWFFYIVAAAYAVLLWQHDIAIAMLANICCGKALALGVITLVTIWSIYWIRARNGSFDASDRGIRESLQVLFAENPGSVPTSLKTDDRTSSWGKFRRGWGLFAAVHLLLCISIFVVVLTKHETASLHTDDRCGQKQTIQTQQEPTSGEGKVAAEPTNLYDPNTGQKIGVKDPCTGTYQFNDGRHCQAEEIQSKKVTQKTDELQDAETRLKKIEKGETLDRMASANGNCWVLAEGSVGCFGCCGGNRCFESCWDYQ